MTDIYKIITLIFLAGIFFSCEKTIDFKNSEIDPLIVVNGEIHPGDSVVVEVRKSRSVLEKNFYYESLPEATVKLFEDGIFMEELQYAARTDTFIEYLNYGVEKIHEYPTGFYYSRNTIVKSGSVYRLEIASPGFNDVSCETTVPSPVGINSLVLSSEVKEEEYGGEVVEVKAGMNFLEPASEQNFYNIRVDGIRGYDKNIPGYSYYNGYDHGQEYTEEIKPSDTIMIGYQPISYIYSSDPILNAESYGDIMGYNPDLSTYFTDELIDGKNYTLIFNFNLYRKIFTEYGEFFTTNVYLGNLSPELHYYLVSRIRQNMVNDNPFAEPVPVYSNVEGGLGIFGSLAVYSFSATIGEYPVEGKTYLPEVDIYNMGGK